MQLTNPFLNFEMLRLHKLIKTKSTGTPQELARKLNCSERTARHKIEILRDAGLPIAYCKTRGCYYYTEEVSISIQLVLGKEEMHRITGGQSKQTFFKKNVETANLLPYDDRNLSL